MKIYLGSKNYLLILSRYWQCSRCSQRYLKSHGTRNPTLHLNGVHSIYEEQAAVSKRMKQAQQSIEKSMGVAATREMQRQSVQNSELERLNQVHELRFPQLEAETLEILYVSPHSRAIIPVQFSRILEIRGYNLISLFLDSLDYQS